VAIPDGLRATVLRRLRRLEPTERTVIMRAAVIGRSFDVHVVMATAPCSESKVRVALERACRLQLVEACGSNRYSFRHALTHDIIFTEFLGGRIRPLHRRIAKLLERAYRGGEPVLEQLAYHAWAGADCERTLRYNELAGDGAAAVHAYGDARRYYDRAKSLLEIDSLGYERVMQKIGAIDDAG
jgi:predicted ATPase